ncbi:hypothetical protein CIHG_05444 [Coccidioides immitis H538.4]|uniref:Uncharacterized protein n=2 Tax=Coccidioides immitis TaxID=5501 RepID=A0A0J8UL71_COCIT|nr:hypothetical protein CIRG_02235 [Coccidioides immitis RMSCC 2394]KMU88273.1 hypothetical protein CIHG_05444 [Coccidioides immitis H538.4]
MYSVRRIHGMSSPRDVCYQVTVVLSSGHRELICILGTPYARIRLFRWSFLAGNNWNAVPVVQWRARALGFRSFGMERSLETQAQNLLFPEYWLVSLKFLSSIRLAPLPFRNNKPVLKKRRSANPWKFHRP